MPHLTTSKQCIQKPVYTSCILMLILFSFYTTAAQQQDEIPPHQTFTLFSEKVNESRTINVWTPPEYDNPAASFPVLYMPDGGINEDFSHIAATIADLVKRKKIYPVILVGIENTQRRRDLTGPTIIEKDKAIAPIIGGAAQFRAFISEELFPFIDKRYRTSEQKGIIGESLAGLFVTETFLLHPGLFDFYIAFDPSLWWNNKFLLQQANALLKAFPATPKKFWFAASGTKDILGAVRKLAKIIGTSKIKNLDWQYTEERKEKHNTIFRAAKEKALIWSMGIKQ